MTPDLSEEEKIALAAELKRTIEADHYPLSPRIRALRAILDKLEPPAPVPEPLPAPKRYAPPRAKRRPR